MDFLYFLIAGLIIAIVISNKQSKEKEIVILKANYESALKGTDKGQALRYGRAYYGALRGKKPLTIYDEQAIANDLATMINN